jgi:CRP-like cAMP-binding protein
MSLTPWIRHNGFLSSLSSPLLERLSPHLLLQELAHDSAVLEPGKRPQHILFPLTGVCSIQVISADDHFSEICMVGNEGAIGILDWLYTGSQCRRIAVLQPGQVLRIPVRTLIATVGESPEFQRRLLVYQREALSYLSQLNLCNQFHAVDQRLGRWLLALHERLSGHDLLLTQEDIARALGVRRESVAVAMGQLEARGIVRGSRRRVTIVDADALAGVACGCLRDLWRSALKTPPAAAFRRPGTTMALAAGAP